MLDAIDKTIINELQGGFPICETPWQQLEQQLKIPADVIRQRIDDMQQQGYISRFGPMYHAERLGGGLTLAAMQVGEARFDDICELVNSFPEVAHNYQRDHRLNMWFVIATEKPEQIQTVIDAIERRSGLRVYNMPKLQEYFLNLRFDV